MTNEKKLKDRSVLLDGKVVLSKEMVIPAYLVKEITVILKKVTIYPDVEEFVLAGVRNQILNTIDFIKQY